MIPARHGVQLLALSAAIASTAQAQVTVNDDTLTTTEGVPATINVLANDTTDIQGADVVVSIDIVKDADYGTVVFDPETDLHTYTPNPGYIGPDSFTYEAHDNDEYGYGEIGTVNITVEASNTDPDPEDLESQVTGENNKTVARTIDRICDESDLSEDLFSKICGDFGDEDINEVVRQIAPEETLLLRRINNQALRGHSSRLFQHQRTLRSGDQQAIAFNGNALSLKNYFGGSAGDNLPAKASIFATVHSEKADYDNTSKETGHDYTTNGLTFGGDYRIQPNLFIGAAVGLIKQDLDYNRNAGDLESDLTTLTGYLSYFHNDINIDMQLSYGESDYDINRNLDLFATEANGSTEGSQYAISTQADWAFNMDSWKFNPFVRFDYLKVEIDSYQESGGGGLALNVGDQEQDQINSSLGIDIQYTQGYSWGVLIPNLTLTAISESSGNYDPVSFSFVDDGSGTTFELRPDSEDSLFYEYQIGAVAILQGGISCFANFNQTISLNDMDIYRVNIGIRSEL